MRTAKLPRTERQDRERAERLVRIMRGWREFPELLDAWMCDEVSLQEMWDGELDNESPRVRNMMRRELEQISWYG